MAYIFPSNETKQKKNIAPVFSFFQLLCLFAQEMVNIEAVGRLQIWKKLHFMNIGFEHWTLEPLRTLVGLNFERIKNCKYSNNLVVDVLKTFQAMNIAPIFIFSTLCSFVHEICQN